MTPKFHYAHHLAIRGFEHRSASTKPADHAVCDGRLLRCRTLVTVLGLTKQLRLADRVEDLPADAITNDVCLIGPGHRKRQPSRLTEISIHTPIHRANEIAINTLIVPRQHPINHRTLQSNCSTNSLHFSKLFLARRVRTVLLRYCREFRLSAMWTLFSMLSRIVRLRRDCYATRLNLMGDCYVTVSR